MVRHVVIVKIHVANVINALIVVAMNLVVTAENVGNVMPVAYKDARFVDCVLVVTEKSALATIVVSTVEMKIV